ncbi:MAG: tRNA (guanosine(37)-N1)-methyltransferase TrmD, partial [Clostridia bacterium]|nr:tRNA (guanosine(37)-N1)-methyltransferase TrmD [Clostridia bacterium]
MKSFYVLTLFPEMIEGTLSHSITGRAIKEGIINVEAV